MIWAVRLSPAERTVLRTCRTVPDMLAVVRSARRELQSGMRGRERLSFGNTVRHVILVGVIRQPALFILGPIVAVVCYVAFFYAVFFG